MIIHLNPTKLIAIFIPHDSIDWSWDKDRNCISATLKGFDSEKDWFSEKIKGKCKLVGVIENGNIGFNPEKYIGKGIKRTKLPSNFDPNWEGEVSQIMYFCYLQKGNGDIITLPCHENAYHSFESLLEMHGINFKSNKIAIVEKL